MGEGERDTHKIHGVGKRRELADVCFLPARTLGRACLSTADADREGLKWTDSNTNVQSMTTGYVGARHGSVHGLSEQRNKNKFLGSQMDVLPEVLFS